MRFNSGRLNLRIGIYFQAITFYEAAMKTGRKDVLRIRFAEQLYRVGYFAKCKRVLREVLDGHGEPTGFSRGLLVKNGGRLKKPPLCVIMSAIGCYSLRCISKRTIGARQQMPS